jgi:DNA repair protein RAD5
MLISENEYSVTHRGNLNITENDVINNVDLIGFTYKGFKIGFEYKGNYECLSFNCGYNSVDNLALHEAFHGSPLWNYIIFVKGSYYSYSRIHVKVYINTDFISQFINKSIGLSSCIINTYHKLQDLPFSYSVNTSSFLPYCNEFKIHSKNNNFQIDLYPYQKQSLSRMLSIENNNIVRELERTFIIKFNEETIMFDPVPGCVVNEEVNCKIETKGGILADEMGLGKTITSLALINYNKSTETSIFINNNNNNNRIYSKATLLICPAHLAKQWLSEAKKCIKNLKVILITTKVNHSKIRYEDIKDADLIIVTQSFLMNFKYYPSLRYQYVTPSSFRFEHRNNHMENLLNSWITEAHEVEEYSQVVRRNYESEWDNIKSRKDVIFEMFHFHRVMIDEGHEIFGEMLSNATMSSYISTWLKSVNASYYWYISGTPFINKTGLINCAAFIKLKIEISKNKKLSYNRNTFYANDFMTKLDFINKLIPKICIRHLKNDVSEQVKIPGYTEQIMWVELTEIERSLYNSRKGRTTKTVLQQMCCHPLVADSYHQVVGNASVSLEEIQEKLITYHEEKIKHYSERIENLNSNATEYYMLKSTFTTKLTESKYILKVLKKIVDSEGQNINEDENCVICYDDFNNPALTPCGHMFCYECLDMCLKSKKKCPICKTDLHNKEIILINKKEKKEFNENSNPLVKKYGSKLGKIISMIRKLVTREDTRIIIFSQWDRMLQLIGKSLAENGIETSFVKGNVWARNSAIKKFKLGVNSSGEDNKVIMLSLKNSASGTNLTEATHIFFVEPINASTLECKSIEGQAIGRACRLGQKNKINVIRVLSRNTIEEEIYEKSYRNNLEDTGEVEILSEELQGNLVI